MGFQSSYMPPPRFKSPSVSVVPRERVRSPVDRDFLWLSSPDAGAFIPSASAKQILQRIANRHGVSIAELRGEGRGAKVKTARHDAVCELRKAMPHWSLAKLGRFIGRDHTTVIYILWRNGLHPGRGFERRRGHLVQVGGEAA